MLSDLVGHVWLKTHDEKRGPWQLPWEEPVSVGRDPRSGLILPHSWIPRALCRFVPTPLGWLVQLGPRARARVVNDYVGDHVFDRHAVVALQEGASTITFPELDELVQLGVRILPGASPSHEPDVHVPELPVLRDRRDGEEVSGTRYAAGRVNLTRLQRERAAVTFLWLLRGDPKPENILALGAHRLGISQAALTQTLLGVRDRVNEERWLNLGSMEQLGHYLCHLSRNLNLEDLPADIPRRHD
jgi:hypothetical protein